MRYPKLRIAWHLFSVFLIGVGACFFAMRTRAPLSIWMIGADDVEDELARRAAAGDPVQAELLSWSAARPGLSWESSGFESAHENAAFAACDPCELAVPAGLAVFEAEAASPWKSPPGAHALPSPLWLFAFGEHYAAELEAAAVEHDADRVFDIARRFRCLALLASEPTNLLRGLMGARVEGQFLRACEAALPSLTSEEQRKLLELLPIDESADRDRRFVSALRAERAFLHRTYRGFAGAGGAGTGLLFGGDSARPLHGEFLACLVDYDRALAALQHATHRDVALALNDLANATRNGLRGELSKAAIPPLCSAYEDFVRLVALERCARVARVRLTDGVEAALALASELTDPCDGLPLRARSRDDGVFEVWSVGPSYHYRTPTSAADSGAVDQDILFRVPTQRE